MHIKKDIFIISEIRALMEQNNKYRIAYTPRSCNLVAHVLVKMTFSNSTPRVWIDELPIEIEMLL